VKSDEVHEILQLITIDGCAGSGLPREMMR
jgi:hypothetical protein